MCVFLLQNAIFHRDLRGDSLNDMQKSEVKDTWSVGLQVLKTVLKYNLF